MKDLVGYCNGATVAFIVLYWTPETFSKEIYSSDFKSTILYYQIKHDEYHNHCHVAFGSQVMTPTNMYLSEAGINNSGDIYVEEDELAGFSNLITHMHLYIGKRVRLALFGKNNNGHALGIWDHHTAETVILFDYCYGIISFSGSKRFIQLTSFISQHIQSNLSPLGGIKSWRAHIYDVNPEYLITRYTKQHNI